MVFLDSYFTKKSCTDCEFGWQNLSSYKKCPRNFSREWKFELAGTRFHGKKGSPWTGKVLVLRFFVTCFYWDKQSLPGTLRDG